MGLSRTWCQSGEFVLECEKFLVSPIVQLHVHTPENITVPEFNDVLAGIG